jgi:hypothetical protein
VGRLLSCVRLFLSIVTEVIHEMDSDLVDYMDLGGTIAPTTPDAERSFFFFNGGSQTKGGGK